MGDESTPIFQGVKHFYLPKMVIIDCKYDRSPLKKIKNLGCTFIRSCGDVAFVKVFKEERIYRTFAWMTKLFVEAQWWRYN